MASDGADAPSVSVRTTLPRLPELTQRPVIRTERLVMRALTQDDLAAFYELRRNPGFMAESSLGKPDADVAESQAALDDLVNPPPPSSSSSSSSGPGKYGKEHFIFGVFVAATGELIGDAGIHTVRGSGMGWPEVGYKLHPAHWGRGYATEAVGAILGAWWDLPREPAEIAVHPGTLRESRQEEDREEEEEEGGGSVRRRRSREHVAAEIAHYNDGSRRVLEKLGFRDFGSWEEPDTQLHRLGQPLMMGHFVLSCPS